MTEMEKNASPLRVVICLAMFLALAWLLTGSYAVPNGFSAQGSGNDVIVAENFDSIGAMSAILTTPAQEMPSQMPTQSPEPEVEEEPEPMEELLPPVSVRKSPYTTSPESETGTWVSQGTGWMFLVDGAAYTGWLNDKDGKRYYLDPDGMMHTGWLEEGGKKYYLDADGIMQTGEVTIGKETYTFFPSGVLDDGSGDIDVARVNEQASESDPDIKKNRSLNILL